MNESVTWCEWRTLYNVLLFYCSIEKAYWPVCRNSCLEKEWSLFKRILCFRYNNSPIFRIECFRKQFLQPKIMFLCMWYTKETVVACYKEPLKCQERNILQLICNNKFSGKWTRKWQIWALKFLKMIWIQSHFTRYESWSL